MTQGRLFSGIGRWSNPLARSAPTPRIAFAQASIAFAQATSDGELQHMTLSKVKLVAIIVAPLFAGACFVAAAISLMSGLEPPRITAPLVSANVCVPGDASVHRVARHGRPRREKGLSPSRASSTIKAMNDGE